MKIFLAAVSLILHCKLIAQSKLDTTYKNTYYEQKLTLFRLLPNTKREIIFLGNSITDIAEWAEIWQNKKVKNRGISSDNTFGVLARLDEVTESKPAKVFIMIGINDIAKETPDSVIIANYKMIVTRIQAESPKTKIVVQSILPTNNDFTEFKRHQNKMEHIIAINTVLQNFCKDRSLVYVDLYTAFLDENKKLDKKYTNDGLHLNGYGYMKWKEVLLGIGLMK